MSGKAITPALGDKSFSCPHCSAISHQTWYKAYIDRYGKDNKPWLPDPAAIEKIEKDGNIESRTVVSFFKRIIAKEVFVDNHSESTYLKAELINLHISRCYSCEKYAIWIADILIYPPQPTEIQPDAEMPEDIRMDFLEAASIVDKSPRGAAALLRLCIQKLMSHLELKGKKIDEDIGALVKRGLDPKIQKALDVVRVIGNSAVHPGQIDLRDDKSTAARLFWLVNLIVESMIAAPKHVEAMYEALPEGALLAIEKRDGAKESESKPTEGSQPDQSDEKNQLKKS